jgi:hypothetical protein
MKTTANVVIWLLIVHHYSKVFSRNTCVDKRKSNFYKTAVYVKIYELSTAEYFHYNEKVAKPWRRGIVVIASAYRKEYPGFESRQGVRFLGI